MSTPDRSTSGREPDAGYRLRQQDAKGFPRDRTVLLVIDPVNDFLSEGGAAWDLAKWTVKKHDVVGNLKRAIDGARERRVPVLFAPMAYTEEDYADRELQRRSGINRLMFERKMFLAGSWGADFHPELRPRDDEAVLLPHKGIDVFETDLPDHLNRLGTTHLVIAGMTASLCCESTGRRAMEHGYDVTFLSDAIGADNPAAYEAAIHLTYPLIANAVLEAEEFLAALEGEEGVPVEPGDVVRGSDHGEIGEVKEVVEPSARTSGYLLVPRGRVFERDTYIPLDAVVKKAGRDLFVNIPKLVVGKMPWDAPPSPADQEAKRGPRSGEVERLYRSRDPSIGA
ncbi:MAG: cysteine hydrolase [Actinomycetota bacterium]|nr:cysteine hydrolase [Actinomycetota bacterium]